MNCLILKRQPPTYNSWKGASIIKKDNYKKQLLEVLLKYNPSFTIIQGELYGTVYHFFNKDVKIDADNLSKPLWDFLKSILFEDDYQLKIRLAGSFNLVKNDFSVLDFSGLSGNLITDLLDAFDNDEHVIYIEYGKLDYSMFTFNLEQ